ncbi:MAG: phenylalanine--tRNA ligase subunit beta [Candidatus Babeliales bacterium]
MKLSLSWIFDHIVGSWHKQDIPALVQKFNQTTAEIESFKKVTLPLQELFLVRVVRNEEQATLASCPELKQELSLPQRPGALVGAVYMIRKTAKNFRWAELADLFSAKEGLVPALSCAEDELAGGWKKSIEAEDYIFELDNKSITNRPDLWGHRGVAREIAALLQLTLKDEKDFLADIPEKQYEKSAAATKTDPFSTEIHDSAAAPRFATLYVSDVAYRASWLWMACRLARVDARPIDAIVDLTNYVMLDLSEPMHAFDAAKIGTKTIGPRFAQQGQKLTLLDGQTIELTKHDLVISDGKEALALAGIMGGLATAVTPTTTSLLLEAACFDAGTIRKSSQQFHIRTEASARFEKSLDPNQNVAALRRFVHLAHAEKLPMVVAEHIVSLGKPAQPKVIELSQDFIESRIGTVLQQDFIIKTLQELGFSVEHLKKDGVSLYRVTVPTFRASKDITIKEDIVEEIARFFGYDNIPLVVPSLPIKPSDNSAVYITRTIKEICAFGMQAHEQQNYALYDEQFLQELSWQPANAARLKNPLSEHWQRLVTSLIPHLVKNIKDNVVHQDDLRFFEINKIWSEDKKDITEQTSLAGIFYEKKKAVDFYQAKECLTALFQALGITASWQKKVKPEQPWYHPYQTAVLYADDVLLGYAGMLNTGFTMNVLEGDAFLFELDMQALLTLARKNSHKQFKPLPKFPGTSLDVSMFVPLSVTVGNLTQIIQDADKRITSVALVDFFHKEEWGDKKSITMRFEACDPDKTLSKEDIDALYAQVLAALKKVHAVVR